MLAKTRQGRAMSMAKRERKPSTFSGMMPLRAIQNPMMPIPKRTSTDSNAIMKISISYPVDSYCPFYNNYEEIICRFQQIFNHADTLSYYNKMVHYDLIANLPALLHVEDRVSMAVSLESRVPLLDYRIVDLVTSMPPSMKFRGAEMKYILKKATANVLPPIILKRKDKMGFPVPLSEWIKSDLYEFISDIFTDQRARQREYLSPDFDIHELISTEAKFGRKLWGLLCLELWQQEFHDKQNYYKGLLQQVR